jgi:hypothetical protein
MATILAESRSETESAFQGMPSKPTDNKRTTALPHLFGPAVLVLMLIFGFIVGVTSWEGFPRTFPKFPSVAPEWNTLKELFNLQVSEYKAGLGRLDTNLSAQALLVATAVLVIVRRSDSLNFFGNSIPLSWLHVFIPILLVFLFGSFGYISHRLISGRMLGLQMAERSPHHEEYRNLFRDASWIDGWYMAFVDPNTSNISGIARDYSGFVSILLVIVLGTLIAASHASALDVESRFFVTKDSVKNFRFVRRCI